jgi:N-methylhydantoinase A
LLAAGGGGPGHAAEIARVLGINTVVIPPYAGLFASLGMLWSPPERRVSHAVKLRLERADAGATLDTALRTLLTATKDESFDGEPAIHEEVDVHYAGQFHDLTVPVVRKGGVIDTAGIRNAFESEHDRSYGYKSAHESCEVGSVRLVMRYPGATIQPNFYEDHVSQITQEAGELRQIYFGSRLGMQTARLLSRKDLSEKPIQGPIVIPEYDTTIIIPPDFTVRREKTGALILERVKVGG